MHIHTYIYYTAHTANIGRERPQTIRSLLHINHLFNIHSSSYLKHTFMHSFIYSRTLSFSSLGLLTSSFFSSLFYSSNLTYSHILSLSCYSHTLTLFYTVSPILQLPILGFNACMSICKSNPANKTIGR